LNNLFDWIVNLSANIWNDVLFLPHTFVNVFNFVVGGDTEGPWFMPDILVNVHRAGDESVGVIKEVLPVCWSKRFVLCVEKYIDFMLV
jgi:hypothetical protein